MDELRSVDCPAELPRVTLQRPRDWHRFEGPGCICRGADGALTLKPYAPIDLPDVFARVTGAPGTLIDAAELYDVQAVDMHGRSWHATGALPKLSTSLPTGTAVVRARLNQWSASETREKEGTSALTVTFECDDDVPANQVEHLERRIGERVLEQSWRHAAASIPMDEGTIELRREGPSLIASIQGMRDERDSSTLVERLTGTLEFVLGRRLQPEHVYSVAGRIRSQVIYSTDRERLKSSISPPYCWRSQGNEASALELIAQYFRYLTTVLPERAAELRRWVSEVIEAGNVALEIRALVLCVAVEGVAKLLLADRPTDVAVERELERALDAIRHVELAQDLRNRCLGALDALRRPRPRDLLKDLVYCGAIPNAQLRDWLSLRNQTAHAERVAVVDYGSMVEKSYSVLGLFYRLIFLITDYRGAFSDYAQADWPASRWPPS